MTDFVIALVCVGLFAMTWGLLALSDWLLGTEK